MNHLPNCDPAHGNSGPGGLPLPAIADAGVRNYRRTGQCKVCGEQIEYVTDPPDANWWRHVGVSGGQPHPASPRRRDGAS